MASMMSKQLGDFLQQQQEPFNLEVYLLERGYRIHKNKFNCSSTRGVQLKRNLKVLPSCSKIAKALFNRLLTINNDQKVQNSGTGSRDQNSKIDKRRHEIADEDNVKDDAQCSSQRAHFLSTAVHYHASKDAFFLIENEVASGWSFRWRAAEDSSKQLSPVSVLEDTESEEGSSPVSKKCETRRTQLSICETEKPPIYPRIGTQQDFVGTNDSSQYSKNKKAVQQTKQLLFDCVREVVEKHKRDSREGKKFEQILGAEQLWELICENLQLWSKESINETNITRLIHLDALDSPQEWKYFEQQKQEIGMQLVDAVLEDIGSEVFADMISIFS